MLPTRIPLRVLSILSGLSIGLSDQSTVVAVYLPIWTIRGDSYYLFKPLY